MTALMLASWRGNTQIVKKLLDKSADPKLRNNAKNSALDLAERYGHTECVEILKKYLEVHDDRQHNMNAMNQDHEDL